jgi:hypothetical protein
VCELSFGGNINASAQRQRQKLQQLNCLHHGLEVLNNPVPPPCVLLLTCAARVRLQLLRAVGGSAPSAARTAALRQLPQAQQGSGGVEGVWDPQPHLTRHHVDLLLAVLHVLPSASTSTSPSASASANTHESLPTAAVEELRTRVAAAADLAVLQGVLPPKLQAYLARCVLVDVSGAAPATLVVGGRALLAWLHHCRTAPTADGAQQLDLHGGQVWSGAMDALEVAAGLPVPALYDGGAGGLGVEAGTRAR